MNKQFKRTELLYNFETLDYRYAFSAKDDKNNFYAIPMCAGNVLEYNIDSKEITFLQPVKNVDFAYTGGAFDEKRHCIWGFPRNSNYILKIDTNTNQVEEIPLNLSFEASGIHGAHHYSGVLTEDFIYSPPRSKSNGILKISLDTLKAEILPLDAYVGMNTHYSGSILHPNGKIYFLPSVNNKVTVLDPETDKFSCIGESVNYMNFGGAIWTDGNIYSFCNVGIEKIDVNNNTVEIIHKFKNPKSFYGTTLHPNGKLYGVSSNNQVIEYDPEENKAEVKAVFHDLKDSFNICTKGEVMSDDNIYLTPCQGRFFMRLSF